MAVEDFDAAVLDLVDRVPLGRVITYGAVAKSLGRGGPRQVGGVMARLGDAVPWWRVVHANGRVADCHNGMAAHLLAAEGTPMRTPRSVDLSCASWTPANSGEATLTDR